VTAPRCARGWERDAVREGRLGDADAASFWRHARACPDCATDVARDERLRALGRAWAADEPGDLALRRLRRRVLRDVASPPAASARPLRRLAAGLALAAALVPPLLATSWRGERGPRAVPGAAAHPSPPADPFAGSVTASSDVRFTQARAAGVERVRLEAGTIAIHVRPQRAGERFLVELPDGELEVRGTTFQVSVTGDATTRVQVDEGLVQLRLLGRPELTLGAGDSWPRTLREAPSGPRDTSPPLPARSLPRPAPAAVSPAPPPAAPIESYADAMGLLRAGRVDEAAAAFHAFASAHPDATQAEDASFLEALALARAGRGDAAGLAAEHHLASYPGSFHRKEAAILVARAASLRGDCVRARAILDPWLGAAADPDATAALRGCDKVP
jgi:hypothetical protein